MENKFEVVIDNVRKLKAILNTVKDISMDLHLIIEKHQIKLISYNLDKNVIIQSILPINCFLSFYLEPDKVIISVDSTNFFKIVNSFKGNNELKLFIDKVDYNNGVCKNIGLKYLDDVLKLKLSDDSEKEVFISVLEFERNLSISSCKFKSIVNSMSLISDEIKIQFDHSEVSFKCVGDFAEQLHIEKVDNNAEINLHVSISLQLLKSIVKLSNISEDVIISLNNKSHFQLKYNSLEFGQVNVLIGYVENS